MRAFTSSELNPLPTPPASSSRSAFLPGEARNPMSAWSTSNGLRSLAMRGRRFDPPKKAPVLVYRVAIRSVDPSPQGIV